MTAPIIIYRPKLWLQPLDEDGEDDGAAVDVSCDMASVELGVDTPTTDVSTFCGNFQVPGDITVSATLEVTINPDTDDNWADLVGKRVRAELYDRNDATTYRTFETQIMLNPSLYGPTTPGEARTFSFDTAIMSPVVWENVPPPGP
jgi:hypothetical protein